ncbi:DUF255 domain-containing protein [uncultured Polaribacter sp.]|uniref:thioredoxin family protein n=1 Tax=uncultured Polaribacter sp. TaxID=174711 RepID=UPI002626B37D|nr:DUF255 domain-containing protein [uncultured Polaribacter sp.]
MKKYILLLIFFGCVSSFAQEKETLLQTFTFEEVEKKMKQTPKPIIVFNYTDWCKICFGMKQTTFKNSEVITLLNKHFYFILLNGEEKKEILFLGKNFKFLPSGSNTGVHELTKALATVHKKIAYPTTTILNSEFEIDAQLVGFYNSKKIRQVLEKLL